MGIPIRLTIAVLLLFSGFPAVGEVPEALVVTVTKGFRHASIEDAERVLGEIADESGRFTIDFARTDAELLEKMSEEGLRRYRVVIFANTSGELPLPDPFAFLAWVERGGAFLGVHSAADTWHGHVPYLEMLGGEFLTHGPQVIVTCRVAEDGHPATAHLDPAFSLLEEIYEFTRFDRKRVVTLLYLDRHPQTGDPGFFPLAWWRVHGHGRVFYTALGHRPETWHSEWFRGHLAGAMEFLLDDGSRLRPVRIPTPTRDLREADSRRQE